MLRWTINALFCIAAASAWPITLGQSNDFQDETSQGWNGSGIFNVVPGGPAGASDWYLNVEATGNPGPGGNMSAYSLFWGDDYAAAGVTVVQADLCNFSDNELDMRAVWHCNNGSRWTSTNALVLPPNSGWRRCTFALTSSTMTLVSGASTFADAQTGVERLQLRHDPVGQAGGTLVAAVLGVDNVLALDQIPLLPTSFSMFRGSVVSGGLSDITSSDDSRLVVRPGAVFSNAEPPAQIVIETTATQDPIAQIKFTAETQASTTVLQTAVALYDYTAPAYIVQSAQPATTSDTTTVVTVASDVARFIEPGSYKMKARVSWKQTGAVFVYPWLGRLDFAAWSLTPQ